LSTLAIFKHRKIRPITFLWDHVARTTGSPVPVIYPSATACLPLLNSLTRPFGLFLFFQTPPPTTGTNTRSCLAHLFTCHHMPRKRLACTKHTKRAIHLLVSCALYMVACSLDTSAHPVHTPRMHKAHKTRIPSARFVYFVHTYILTRHVHTLRACAACTKRARVMCAYRCAYSCVKTIIIR
jgi:hypothetical protein